MAGMPISDDASLNAAAKAIFARLDCKHLLVTRGEHGMALFSNSEQVDYIPTLAKEVFDVSGAGDTVIATFAMSVAAGAELHQAAVLANAAAGVVVGKLGTATVSVDELTRALRTQAAAS
jgi:D-beta-D-heptose 7-phosphate kinase/D-beta-D-heptose 1-phosphate adenosyltransferase